ncbi:CHRD domain-containing protein [Xylophilus ampelinus]|uniref:CHRD domain-containing protein n=1 Tax=Xylophilus ampelinus TaxID=54067 RepID=A0A318SMT9_9BURK|nr:CHRD domain-containing protein [Xylophilus ampelinus]MCS4509006.1 CHRD domain-containing protein [Xylophilus ampelinus]PYE79968.1 CHRD domain-containing protein [Xylophilus ampelinus]
MNATPRFSRRSLLCAGLATAAVLSGCATPAKPDPDAHLATFTTRLAGTNEVPPNGSMGTGTVDALFDRNTMLLRWKMSYSNLSGPPAMAHFHGPAAIGTNAPPAITFRAPLTSPYDGRATLTQAQAAELLAGRWYVNLHTAQYPGGELRGQMIERR